MRSARCSSRCAHDALAGALPVVPMPQRGQPHAWACHCSGFNKRSAGGGSRSLASVTLVQPCATSTVRGLPAGAAAV